LPVTPQKQVETLIESLSKTTSAKSKGSANRRYKFGWAGGLEDLKDQFTSVELQHRLCLSIS